MRLLADPDGSATPEPRASSSDLFIVSRGFDFMPAGIGIFQLAYVVSEALTNAAKHSRASVVRIDFHAKDALVELSVRDDGIGGADPTQGSGLLGLRDRVEAFGGTMKIASAPGTGTCLDVAFPIDHR
jgi:glucose-6-phosphate-specific signal transduction histidine kinase